MSSDADRQAQPGPGPEPDPRLEQSQDWRALEADVLRLVRRELGPHLRSRVESMDVVQDVLHDVVRDLSQFEGASFRSWIQGIVRNRIRNLADFHGRKRRDPSRERPLDGPLDGAGALPAMRSTLEEVQRQQDHRNLLASLAALTEDERTLILLRDFERMPWERIAKLAGKPSADAARMAYARAMARLTASFEMPGLDGGAG